LNCFFHLHKTTYNLCCIGCKVLEKGGNTAAQDLREGEVNIAFKPCRALKIRKIPILTYPETNSGRRLRSLSIIYLFLLFAKSPTRYHLLSEVLKKNDLR
jgi:hypothetical protein